MIPNLLPRHRLDAGTFGTMGIGPGFAIAAALYVKRFDPGARVVCIEGDSAFGFSGMEVETIARYNLPIVILVVNNNGIYSGFERGVYDEVTEDGEPGLAVPPTALLPRVRYDRLADLVGAEGKLVSTQQEVTTALQAALAADTFTIINLMINPTASRKAQQHEWLTKAKL